MGFLGVYKALYAYEPQSEGELAISEGDVLYLLEKSDEDDWWKAKKRASGEDEDEPVGLIPNNYVEEAQPVSHARALYEYTRQTDEELSFPEDARLAVYDTSDPDWILVGLDGDFGFVPANYIDLEDGDKEEGTETPPPALPSRAPARVEAREPESPPLPPRNVPPEPSSPAASGPAAALAGVLAGRSVSASKATTPPPLSLPPRPQFTPDASDDDADTPPLPTRQRASSNEQPYRSPTTERETRRPTEPARQSSVLSPGGFHMYNINEMVSVMGKRKKMPTTLGINLKTGTILIAPERAQDGPSQEWTADRMTHYSLEGKHVFIELVRPSKSVDFHAGAKDTAEEIVAALGEMAGAVRAEGLREVIMAGTGQGQKKGQMLYDFMAQGEDEVTVGVGDEVIILDDATSEEWWQVRRLKNGKEGVVPSIYVEVTGTVAAQPPSATGINAGRSTVEQNRLEEARLTKEAVKAAQREEQKEREKRASEVGPGMRLPERNSSLSARDSGNSTAQQRGKRENGSSRPSKSKPDASRVRTWTDRSKSFSVEAQFLGLKDGKINLHKMNGVKIAVPIAKMSSEDLEYIERMTGLSLDEDKPLSDVKKRAGDKSSGSAGRIGAGVTVQQPRKPDYDWFQFFLGCDVAVGLCERYAQAFIKDSMDESVLPDVDASVLRNLGLREGDIIKVMRFLDAKYTRTKKSGDADGDGGGLFSGPGGALRNNTRKGRPAPAVQTNDVIDAKALSQQKESSADGNTSPVPASGSPAATEQQQKQRASGFDDNAWEVKPLKQQTPEPTPQAAARAPEAALAAATASKPAQPLTGSMQELSLLSAPLQPTKASPPAGTASAPAPQVAPAPPAPPAAAAAPQLPGATPGFFSGIAQQQTRIPQQLGINGQQFGQVAPQSITRQRPIPPQYTQGGPNALAPPPPSRPLSAPQSAQPSAFAPPPLQPQMTGIPPFHQQIAPPGQSLNEINQARLQQQYAQQMQQQMQSQPMGFGPQPTGPMGAFPAGVQPQQTGFGPNQFMQPMMNGPQQMQSPFADPIRPGQFSPIQGQQTGFPPFNPGQQQGYGGAGPAPGSINSFLPPALEPQRTAMPPPMPPQQTGMVGPGFSQGFIPNAMPAPPQQQPLSMAAAPLQPQKTGPAPPVRFGVTPEVKKMMPQPTGRRANLSAATPQNPFGF